MPSACARATLVPVLAGGLLLLAACAPVGEATPPASTAGTPAVTPAATVAPPAVDPTTDAAAQPAAVPTDWCADPEIAAEVEAALASGVESNHNGMLVSPQEMGASGGTAVDVDRQVRVWRELPPAQAAFQQCLRVRQGQPTVERMPGARW
ncbi:hypothetical protein [Cellulomonas phragmiteti]|uniref:Lipoprotein n=1 Tax=Cellulomonas phragmiteti TaxID=478780 RepID=A0ABQ4DIV7_9CELL|nr:hypothetical protein [Cellulomonas phragmiteti]GIG39275.1 hypothetical protein Cph01nite_10370 [Cellulomonas phragmiteti]